MAIRFTVIGGYLGAGKTTLLNRILAQNQGIRFALLINDFGEINIDAALIESTTDTQINLTNGCVCCTLVDGFHEAIDQLSRLDPPPDQIVVEASGVADVSMLARYGYAPNLNLDGVIVIADAETVQKKAQDKYVATTVRRQLASADIIVLSKTDLISPETVQVRLDWLNSEFPDTRVVEASFGEVPLALLFDIYQQRIPLQHTPHESYATWKFEGAHSVTREALGQFIDSLPDDVIRLKGFVSQTAGPVLLAQIVGRRIEIVETTVQRDGIQLTAIGLEDQLDIDHMNEIAARTLVPRN